MKMRSVALAALSTAMGIAVVQASEGFSAFQPPVSPTVAEPEVPADYTPGEVFRLLDTTSGPVVLVRAQTDEVPGEALPVWIGEAEARAIARGLLRQDALRPLTHDLLADVVHGLDAKVHHVRIDGLRADGVYTGAIALSTKQGPLVIDARPSDALALALRTSTPIYLGPTLAPHMLTLEGS